MRFDISIVIVNYNTKEYLLNCIDSIFQSKYRGNLEVIVVDNNSSDNSLQLIKKNENQIEIIENSTNLGFSKAVNIGLKKCNGKYICILNPDTIIVYDCLEKLFDYMEKEQDVACISPKILNSFFSIGMLLCA